MIQNFENIFEVVLVGEASSFNSATLIKTNSCIDIFEAFDNTFRNFFKKNYSKHLQSPCLHKTFFLSLYQFHSNNRKCQLLNILIYIQITYTQVMFKLMRSFIMCHNPSGLIYKAFMEVQILFSCGQVKLASSEPVNICSIDWVQIGLLLAKVWSMCRSGDNHSTCSRDTNIIGTSERVLNWICCGGDSILCPCILVNMWQWHQPLWKSYQLN